MFTKNFYDLIRSVLIYSNALITSVDGATHNANYSLINGTSYSNGGYGFRYAMRNGRIANPENGKNASYGVYFGTGTAPATPTDLTLEAPITSGINITSPGDMVISVQDGYYEMSSTFGLQNNSYTASYAISEVGLFLKYQSSSSSGTSDKMFMIERTVLSSPITLAPMEAKQITYTVRFKYPTA